MARLDQEALRAAWLEAPCGCLSAWSQARAWALRECWREEKDSDYGMLAFIAGKITKSGGGHPSPQALGQFFAKADADESWFPGKLEGEPRGRKRGLSKMQEASIARSAMAMKANNVEPTYTRLLAGCPKATVSASTGSAASPDAIYRVLKERCYDNPENPDEKWEHQARLSRTALPDDVLAKRLAWGEYMRDEAHHTQQWYFKHCVWTDLCNKILPRSAQKANKMVLARKAGKGWMSNGAKAYSRNLRADSAVLKQNSWDTVRVWWAPILMRGKLHVEVLGTEFPGESSEGAAILVAKVRSAINIRFHGDDKPDIVCTDRGRGFFAPKTRHQCRHSQELR